VTAIDTRSTERAQGSTDQMACAACGQPLAQFPCVRLAQARLINCERCGTWTYWPRPTQTGQAALHDSAEYFEHPYFEQRRRVTSKLDRRCREIFERLRIAGVDIASLRGRRVLDIGCDTGAFLSSAARQFGVIPVGIDVAARPVGVARDSGIEAYQASVEDAPSPLRDYPLITAIDLIEHVTDPLTFLRAIRERLMPGGVSYIETPNIGSAVYRFGGLLCRLTRGHPGAVFERLFPPQHIQYFTKHSLAGLVRQSGLELLSLSTRGLPGRDLAVSLPVWLGMAVLQASDRMTDAGILICAILRRPAHA